MRAAWRNDFPWTRRLVYLQHAFNSQMPRQAVEEVLEYFLHQTHLGFVQSDASPMVEEARSNVAGAIGAKPEEVAFTQSYTEGLNIATSNINWERKNNIVIGEGDYFSTIVHFVNLVRKHRAELRIIPFDEDGFLMVDEAKKLIDGDTAMVHLVHVPNGVGTIQPVRKIFEYASDMGALTVVDSAQSTGIIPHKVGDLKCDFYSSVGKKWLMGPVGTAFFWCREDLIGEMEPPIVGKHFQSYDLEDVRLVETAERFESTTLNHPGIAGLNAAVKYWSEIGVETIEASIQDLIAYLIEKLTEELDAEIVGTTDMRKRTGIICFTLPGLDERHVTDTLGDRYGIICAHGVGRTPAMRVFAGRHVIRVSTHFYNSRSDVDKLVQSIKEIRRAR